MQFKVGRPIKHSYAKKLALLNELEAYIQAEEYPTMPKFCTAHKISKQRMYEWAKNEKESREGKTKYPLGEYFTELIRQMNAKQEAFIEENTMKGNIAPSFAIFKLKQQGFGWTDKQDFSVSGDVKISIGLPPDFQER